MSNVKFKNRKTFQLAIVLVLVIGIILAGTFAWVNFTQSALNVFEGWTNPDVNLHDDYDPGDLNKDVYVENSGQRPLYVRVRLDEFMAIDGEPVISTAQKGTDENSLKTWHPHSYLGNSPASCGEEFHDYYDWTLGSNASGTTDPDKGFKYYVPAPFANRAVFSEDGKTGLRLPTESVYQDKNGVETKLYGTVGTDEASYTTSLKSLKDTYVAINAILATGTNRSDLDVLYATLDSAPDKATRTAAQTAINTFLTTNNLGYYDLSYDVDYTTSVEGDVKPKAGTTKIQFVPIERTMSSTTVYTMAQWISKGTPTGNFWIMDNDGWCYWGNVLLPNQATGLLLSEVALGPNPPAGVWYYGINAKLEAVTVDDLTKFDTTGNNGITDQGTMVLMAVSGNYVFDMEAGHVGVNDPVYTFVNNEDNTYRKMITNGASVTYDHLFVYTGTVPPLTKGAIFASPEYKSTATATTFKKDIPLGLNQVTFKVIDAGNGTGVIEGADGKHYIKLGYDDPTTVPVDFDKTAWLAVGADGKFDKLPAGATPIATGDDVLVWVKDGEKPGLGNNRYQEADNSNIVKVNDAFNTDTSYKWVVVGKATSGAHTGKTLIVSDKVLEANVLTGDVTTKVASYDATKLTELYAIDNTITPATLSIQDSLDYFANNAARVANNPAGTAPSKWWLSDGIIGTNGAVLATDAAAADVGVRVAFWIDTTKLQNGVDAKTIALTH